MIFLESLKRVINWARTAVGNFWKNFTDAIKKSADKLAKKMSRPVMGISAYFRRVGDKNQDRTRYYSKEQGRWKETIVTRTLAEGELPQEYQSRLIPDEDMDLSDELEMAMR